MLRSYIFIFLRSLRKARLHTSINVLGLAFGLTSAILITLYIYDELSFDSMHPHPDRTYRLGFGREFNNGNSGFGAEAPGVIARRLKDELPEVEQILRALHVNFPTTISNKAGDKSILTNDCRWVDSSLAQVLALDLVQGNRDKLFEQQNSIVISESAAREMFGQQDALGKTLTIADKNIMRDQESEVVVSGVYRDYPANSTFRFKYLINLESIRPFTGGQGWEALTDRVSFETYVLLHEGADVKKFETFLQSVSDDLKKQDDGMRKAFTSAIPIRDIHFNNAATWDFTGTAGDKKSLAILSSIAILILIIACINYMNLATARATQRAKEVGIRKSLGSSRAKLTLQFMLESSALALTALVLSLVMAQLFLPTFNTLSWKHFTTSDFFRPEIILLTTGITLFTMLVGGSYPAFVLSRFKPIAVLKGASTGRQRGLTFRSSLVTLQYAVSISLTIVAIVIFRQVSLMHGSKLNEQGEQIMMLRFGSVAQYDKFFPLKEDLLKNPGIQEVSLGEALPRMDHWGNAQVDATIPELDSKPMTFNQFLMDFDFIKMFNLSVVAGRDFDSTSASDSLSVMINEKAVKAMNLTNEQVIGHTLSIKLYRDEDPNGGKVERTIVGVVKDFPYTSIRHAIEPLILHPNPNLRGYQIGTMVLVKLPKEKIAETIKSVEASWKKNFPDIGLQYYFVNEIFGRIYKSELTTSSLTLNFAGLSIIITVFGLFGLASFDAERRTKEIGVRKVHGANIWQITSLLFGNFLRIFCIAAVLAVPLDYFILDNWLASYQYRTTLDIFVFVGSLGALMIVTIVAVGYETIRAARANPIKSLRYE